MSFTGTNYRDEDEPGDEFTEGYTFTDRTGRKINIPARRRKGKGYYRHKRMSSSRASDIAIAFHEETGMSCYVTDCPGGIGKEAIVPMEWLEEWLVAMEKIAPE